MTVGLRCRYNTENGGPALEKLTNAIHAGTEKIKQYYIADEDLLVNYSKTGTTQYLVQTHGSSKFRPFTVQVQTVLNASSHECPNSICSDLRHMS